MGSQIVPNSTWLQAKNIPARTTSRGLSKYDIFLAQQSAIMAVKFPFQLTDMVAKGMCGDTEIEIVGDVDSTNPILSANSGDSWGTILVAKEGKVISDVAVTMGGVDITSSSYTASTHEINISNVTGKVTITVTITNA